MMSRNRFVLIEKFLHFNNNEERPEDCTDKLFKVRPILDLLITNFKKYYVPHAQISIDEGTLLWKGRLSFRVYNPMKPIKYGVKAYMLADSISGYCYNFIIYEGTSRTLEIIVVGLLDDLVGLNHRLYMDNFYNSVRLAMLLLDEHKTYSCGTLRKNRGEPSIIRDAGTREVRLQKGEHIARDNRLVMAWQHNRTVRCVTTEHDDSMKEVQVWKKGGGFDLMRKPKAICDYNDYMGGVDHINQMTQYYPLVRKTRKWPKKVFWWFIELAVYNGCVIYNENARREGRKKKIQLEFQKDLVKELCLGGVRGLVSDDDDDNDNDGDDGDDRDQERAAGRPARQGEGAADEEDDDGEEAGAVGHARTPMIDPVTRLLGGMAVHVMDKYTGNIRRRCRVCYKNGKRSESRFYCKPCNIPLCRVGCYQRYHTVRKYF